MRTLDDDALRRYEALSIRPQYRTMPEEVVQQAVIEATSQFLEYTNRTEDPGARADSVIQDLAAAWLNQLGMEGNSVAKDGDLERQVNTTQDTRMALRLDAWRLPMWPRPS